MPGGQRDRACEDGPGRVVAGLAMTRRELLKALAAVGGAVLLVNLGVGPGVGRRREGQAATPPETVSYHWRDAAVGVLGGQPAVGERAYTSDVYRAPGVFNAIGSLWSGQTSKLELRASVDGVNWTPWHAVSTHDYEAMGPTRDGRTSGDLFTGAGWRYAQYRVGVPDGLPPPEVELVLIDSRDGPRVGEASSSGPLSLLAATQPRIISRAEWGCNESYRFNSSGAEVWPRAYRVVPTGIIHHPATSHTYVDAAAEVRAVYYYHAMTLGWGDIGYNYLVDRWGNVYEGRYGGANVVAGHAKGYNYGSTGIACLGNYVSTPPSAEMKNGLARIVAWACRYLDPHGQTHFVDRAYPNIMGHRDVNNTACPGDELYKHLPALRDAVRGILGAVPRPAAQITSVAFIPTRLPQGAALRVEVVVSNTGSGTMTTQGPGVGYTYLEGQSFRTVGYGEIAGAFRVGVDFATNATGLDHPYRWGLPDALEPGQSATVVGYVRMSDLQRRDYWAGVVEEGVRWWATGAGVTLVKVLPSYCFPSASATGQPEPTPQPVSAASASLTRKVYLPLISQSSCD